MDENNNVNTGMPLGDEEATEEVTPVTPEMGEEDKDEDEEEETATPEEGEATEVPASDETI